jgi:hypothetical protein
VLACNYKGLGESKACIHNFCGNISWIVALGRLRKRLEDNIKVMLPTEVGCEDGRWMELTLDCLCDGYVASFSSATGEICNFRVVMPQLSYRAV